MAITRADIHALVKVGIGKRAYHMVRCATALAAGQERGTYLPSEVVLLSKPIPR